MWQLGSKVVKEKMRNGKSNFNEESSKVKKMMQFAMALRRQKFEVQKNFL